MPRVWIRVIVLNGDKVLLGKRVGRYIGSETWSFPGGHLRSMENIGDCALREVREESGLKVKLIDNYPCAVTEDFFKKEGKHYITLYVRAQYISGIPIAKEPERNEQWQWFPWKQDNLPKPLFTPVQNLLKQNYNPFEK